jgi:flagellar biosynthesis protein FliP
MRRPPRYGVSPTAWASALALLLTVPALAASQPLLGAGSTGDNSYLRLLLLLASVSLAPAVLAVLTSFARIVVVLFFLRAGLGAQQILPNPVLIGLALLLTVVSMAGTLQAVNQVAVQPLLAGKLAPAEAARQAEPALRAHLQAHVREADLALFAGSTTPGRSSELTPLGALAAAYVLSELRAAFLIGFVVTLPFLVIDLVVAGTLASLGLTSLPQAVLALPFKVLLFVMVDGWRLLAHTLLASLQ